MVLLIYGYFFYFGFYNLGTIAENGCFLVPPSLLLLSLLLAFVSALLPPLEPPPVPFTPLSFFSRYFSSVDFSPSLPSL
jgi:hypothetical protein